MNRKRFALVLGVNDYPADPQINPLVGAKADALAMYVFLLTKLKFDQVQLVQPEEAGTFLDAVEKSAQALGSQDLLLVYYAGHGFEVNHKHYLLTPTDRINRLRVDQGTMHKEVLVHAMRGGGCQRVLITDSCRSLLTGNRGAEARRESVANDRDLGRREAQGQQGSLTLFDACDEGKSAAELKQIRAGLFTRSLLEIWENRLTDHRAVTIDTQTQTDVALRMRSTAAEFGMDAAQSPWLQNSGLQPVLSEGTAPEPARAQARWPAPEAPSSSTSFPPPAPPPRPAPPPPPSQPTPSPTQPTPPRSFGSADLRDWYDRCRRNRHPRRTIVFAFIIFWIIIGRVMNWGWHLLTFPAPWFHHWRR